MEDVDFKDESEGHRVFRETIDKIDDIQYSDLPMDWDPNVDLLESFEPSYLEDKPLILILEFLKDRMMVILGQLI